jgi:hypothetical protein
MAGRASARKVKVHGQYTYQEAADALGVSLQTVRLWRNAGLHVLDSRKPHLILGHALKDFLTARQGQAKRKLARDQFLCMACNAPSHAFGSMADYTPLTPTRGLLTALCEVCGGACTKFSSPRLRDDLATILSIETRNQK